ncbi:MAG: transposase [Saprospiraceae bacterium]
MIILRWRHISIPLYWELLDNNSGNSNTEDRIDLLKKCIRLLTGRIGLFLGDRAFIGHRWLKFLKDQGIRFCVRVSRHHNITRQVGLQEYVHTLEQLLQGRKTLQLSACRGIG